MPHFFAHALNYNLAFLIDDPKNAQPGCFFITAFGGKKNAGLLTSHLRTFEADVPWANRGITRIALLNSGYVGVTTAAGNHFSSHTISFLNRRFRQRPSSSPDCWCASAFSVKENNDKQAVYRIKALHCYDEFQVFV